MTSIQYLNKTTPFITGFSSPDGDYECNLRFQTLRQSQDYHALLILDLVKDRGEPLPSWAESLYRRLESEE